MACIACVHQLLIGVVLCATIVHVYGQLCYEQYCDGGKGRISNKEGGTSSFYLRLSFVTPLFFWHNNAQEEEPVRTRFAPHT